MMIISHRGNLNGPDLFNENKPETIDYCISKDIPVEIDVRWYKDQFYLGHDEPQYPVTVQYLLENKDWLWIHCKERESFHEILKLKRFNCFWHQNDDYTMTSFGYTWAYPGKMPSGPLCIGVMPEMVWSLEESIKFSFFGLCTDNVIQLQEIINSK